MASHIATPEISFVLLFSTSFRRDIQAGPHATLFPNYQWVKPCTKKCRVICCAGQEGKVTTSTVTERHQAFFHSMRHHHRHFSIDEEALSASREVSGVQEMSSNIVQLRRSKLMLLADDLLRKIRCTLPGASDDLLTKLAALCSDMLMIDDGDDSPIRTSLRSCLWEIRVDLEPLSPPESVRMSLELFRSGLLDCPKAVLDEDESTNHSETGTKCILVDQENNSAVLRGEMHQLMIENILLEELRSFRLLEREVNDTIELYYPQVCLEERHAMHFAAVCLLGMDEHRVRGKSRLANAVEDVVRGLLCHSRTPRLEKNLELAFETISTALSRSLENDLRHRRPAGQAMLLRPRITDIPNFRIVSSHILRGGQPSRNGLKWLLNCGVSLIIDLRGSDRANQWHLPAFYGPNLHHQRPFSVQTQHVFKPHEVSQESFRVHNIPIEDFHAPSFEQVDEFLALIATESASGGMVFVHCKAGIGRTGTLVACWRLSCGESADDAIGKENLYSAFGGGLSQESFVRSYSKRLRGE